MQEKLELNYTLSDGGTPIMQIFCAPGIADEDFLELLRTAKNHIRDEVTAARLDKAKTDTLRRLNCEKMLTFIATHGFFCNCDYDCDNGCCEF